MSWRLISLQVLHVIGMWSQLHAIIALHEVEFNREDFIHNINGLN